ncbi:MAG: hypothetical protein HGB32_10730 [Geobacteraceae bacterium]|nr:hypothetical protein [Geobacteraceae bacterium]NTW80610.1 hypothetical protein [Geobacteraceae bacterium]
MKIFLLNTLVILAISSLAKPCAAGSFQSDSKRFGDSKMDIVITEVERTARTSVLDIKVNKVGSSVGSSFFILCSLSDLAHQRGGFRYVVKIEEKPKRGQMLVGFLNSADEPPKTLDVQLSSAEIIDLEQFATICDRMK